MRKAIMFCVLLAGTLILIGETASAITHGLRIKEGPVTVVEVWNTTVFGQISIQEGLSSAPLTVFLLDQDSVASQPAGVGDSIGGTITNASLATFNKLGAYTFAIQSIGVSGPTTFSVKQYTGGVLSYTSPTIDLQVVSHDQDGNGLILYRNGVPEVKVWEETVVGQLNVLNGLSAGPYNVVFLDPDSIPFIPDTSEFKLEKIITSPANASVDSLAVWWFRVNGLQVGGATVSLGVFHKVDGHSHYNSEPIPIVVSTCVCNCHHDPQCDGVLNVQDVVVTVNVAFRGVASVTDSDCPRQRTDVNCDGVTSVVDVVRVVNVAFRGINQATEFCNGCTQ